MCIFYSPFFLSFFLSLFISFFFFGSAYKRPSSNKGERSHQICRDWVGGESSFFLMIEVVEQRLFVSYKINEGI